ncbi:MAG: glycosyltransferase [Salinivirgaceae bacterium]|nr:MAG: glycosyltransferase [Salinivirgaceae bacterium]
MTDPLGQSQVLPYLFGLVKKGHQITLLSFEKEQRYKQQKKQIESLLAEQNIDWKPLPYTASPPIISSIKDFREMKKTAATLYKNKGFDITHCRGYLPAMCGNYLKKRFGVKLLFDMRGFWPDERVEGGIWNKSNPIFKIVYYYFKRQEKKLFKSADAVVSLTHAGKKIIEKWPYMQTIKTNISVIPCCADFNHFAEEKINISERDQIKNELGIQSKDFIISYLGSIGSWYMLPEMLDFFKVFLKIKSEAKLLFISHDNPEMIQREAKEKDIPTDKILIKGAQRDMVPTILSLSNVSLFFIKPVYSKQASSPTKLAEILGMGIPVIANAGVGDLDDLFNHHFPGFLVNEFTNEEYYKAIDVFLNSDLDKVQLRSTSLKYFSLEDGINKYNLIYNQL